MATTSPDFTKLVSEAQRQAISSLRQAGELSVRAAEAAVGLVPDSATTPRIPTPKELVESGFSFAGEVLDVQRTYALRLADVMTAATVRNAGTAASSASKS